MGYVGKLGVESWREWRQDRAKRLARLLQLQALLRASQTAFRVQRELAGRLAAQLKHKYPNDLPDEPGLERMFTHLYHRFEPEQVEPKPLPAEGSDREGKLVERDRQAPSHRLLDRELVVASSQILHEAMPAITILALRSCLSPRMGRSRAFSLP